ncbi:hypothetical protein CCH79_00019741, partial [Gambusia affinis]
KDSTFTQISRLNFVPQIGDIYSCSVEHLALKEPQTRTWDVETNSPQSGPGPAIFCGVGLTIGLLGVAGHVTLDTPTLIWFREPMRKNLVYFRPANQRAAGDDVISYQNSSSGSGSVEEIQSPVRTVSFRLQNLSMDPVRLCLLISNHSRVSRVTLQNSARPDQSSSGSDQGAAGSNLKCIMGTLTAHLTQSDEEEAAAQREELSLEEAWPVSDVTGWLLRRLQGNRRGCVLLGVCGGVAFTAAFLLALAVFWGRSLCSNEAGPQQAGGGANIPADGGAELYLGELREMMRRLLQDEDLLSTISLVSRVDHPPGSSEGTVLASEVLGRFRKLQMDQTWTESLFATLQVPDRLQNRPSGFESGGVGVVQVAVVDGSLQSLCCPTVISSGAEEPLRRDASGLRGQRPADGHLKDST